MKRMSEMTYGFRKTFLAGGLLFGLGSAVLLGEAWSDHTEAQPHTTVTQQEFSGPAMAEICVKTEQGEKPDCGASYTANIDNASSTLTVHHNYNQQLEDQAGFEAIIAGLSLATAITLGYKSKSV